MTLPDEAENPAERAAECETFFTRALDPVHLQGAFAQWTVGDWYAELVRHGRKLARVTGDNRRAVVELPLVYSEE